MYLGAFCNTFDRHYAIIGLKNFFGLLFEWPLKTCARTVLLAKSASYDMCCLQSYRGLAFQERINTVSSNAESTVLMIQR